MGVEWYDAIARRNGGYKSNAVFTIEGISGEVIFEQRLIKLLKSSSSVLDAGCGHGEFTIKMARNAQQITGFDHSIEMIRIANELLRISNLDNVRFVYATTKEDLPFHNGEFDLIYDRRGPTSILNHSRILKSGGRIIGIHSGAMERVKELLKANGFLEIEIEEFNDAMIYFPDETELAKFLSGIPGNPVYTSQENDDEFKRIVNQFKTRDNRLGMKEWRFIWTAVKP